MAKTEQHTGGNTCFGLMLALTVTDFFQLVSQEDTKFNFYQSN